ncbi:hypothetical protein QR685DRAFT_191522 [Neurospora intermedia]|uniref:Secreted protein n=1 Tax=Neurospora intermedia TaxID=5142 RepID=A0ABR3DMV4_NEUIN
MGAMKLCLWRTLFAAGMTPWIGKEQDIAWREEEGWKIRVVGPRARVRVVSCRIVSCPVVLAVEVMWAWSLPWMSVAVRVSSFPYTHVHRDLFWRQWNGGNGRMRHWSQRSPW